MPEDHSLASWLRQLDAPWGGLQSRGGLQPAPPQDQGVLGGTGFISRYSYRGPNENFVPVMTVSGGNPEADWKKSADS